MAERKRYIDVNVPILRSEMRVLGTPEELNNKTIKLDLTRRLRGKGLNVKFRIFNKDGKLIAVPDKFELTTAYIRRVLRKRISYVEDSFSARTKDLTVTFKPFLITRKKVSRAVRKNLRNTAREFILEYSKEKEYMEICQDLLDNTLQKALLPKLKKVYPLSFCDIRIFETNDISKVDLDKALALQERESSEEDTEEDYDEQPDKFLRVDDEEDSGDESDEDLDDYSEEDEEETSEEEEVEEDKD